MVEMNSLSFLAAEALSKMQKDASPKFDLPAATTSPLPERQQTYSSGDWSPWINDPVGSRVMRSRLFLLNDRGQSPATAGKRPHGCGEELPGATGGKGHNIRSWEGEPGRSDVKIALVSRGTWTLICRGSSQTSSRDPERRTQLFFYSKQQWSIHGFTTPNLRTYFGDKVPRWSSEVATFSSLICLDKTIYLHCTFSILNSNN